MHWSEPTLVIPSLGEGDVHVWRIELGGDPDVLQELVTVLNDSEQLRANRFVVDSARHDYIAARASLRRLLGSYLGEKPSGVPICLAEYGKPFLDKIFNIKDLRFNLSHSGGLCLVAVSKGREVGVDVEKLRRDVDFSELAARYFAPAERDQIAKLTGDSQMSAFFRCWTRKEAYVKAHGGGLRIPLDEFVVSTAADSEFLHSPDSDRWELHSLLPEEGFVGCLVAERPVKGVHFFQHGNPDNR